MTLLHDSLIENMDRSSLSMSGEKIVLDADLQINRTDHASRASCVQEDEEATCKQSSADEGARSAEWDRPRWTCFWCIHRPTFLPAVWWQHTCVHMDVNTSVKGGPVNEPVITKKEILDLYKYHGMAVAGGPAYKGVVPSEMMVFIRKSSHFVRGDEDIQDEELTQPLVLHSDRSAGPGAVCPNSDVLGSKESPREKKETPILCTVKRTETASDPPLPVEGAPSPTHVISSAPSRGNLPNPESEVSAANEHETDRGNAAHYDMPQPSTSGLTPSVCSNSDACKPSSNDRKDSDKFSLLPESAGVPRCNVNRETTVQLTPSRVDTTEQHVRSPSPEITAPASLTVGVSPTCLTRFIVPDWLRSQKPSDVGHFESADSSDEEGSEVPPRRRDSSDEGAFSGMVALPWDYWKRSAPEREQLGRHSTVFIDSVRLKDILRISGPESLSDDGGKDAWMECGWHILLHLLGGKEGILVNHTPGRGVATGLGKAVIKNLVRYVTGLFKVGSPPRAYNIFRQKCATYYRQIVRNTTTTGRGRKVLSQTAASPMRASASTLRPLRSALKKSARASVTSDTVYSASRSKRVSFALDDEHDSDGTGDSDVDSLSGSEIDDFFEEVLRLNPHLSRGRFIAQCSSLHLQTELEALVQQQMPILYNKYFVQAEDVASSSLKLKISSTVGCKMHVGCIDVFPKEMLVQLYTKHGLMDYECLQCGELLKDYQEHDAQVHVASCVIVRSILCPTKFVRRTLEEEEDSDGSLQEEVIELDDDGLVDSGEMEEEALAAPPSVSGDVVQDSNPDRLFVPFKINAFGFFMHQQKLAHRGSEKVSMLSATREKWDDLSAGEKAEWKAKAVVRTRLVNDVLKERRYRDFNLLTAELKSSVHAEADRLTIRYDSATVRTSAAPSGAPPKRKRGRPAGLTVTGRRRKRHRPLDILEGSS